MIGDNTHARDMLNQSLTVHYNSLSYAEMGEDAAWGNVGAEGLAVFIAEIESDDTMGAIA